MQFGDLYCEVIGSYWSPTNNDAAPAGRRSPCWLPLPLSAALVPVGRRSPCWSPTNRVAF